MKAIELGFEERREDIEKLFKFIDYVDSNEDRDLAKKIAPPVEILKASCVLMLYNLVESTVTQGLVQVHDAFSREGLKFEDLSSELQLIWLKHLYHQFQNSSTPKDTLNMIGLFVQSHTLNKIPIDLSFKEYVKHKSGSIYPGNLDSKNIRTLCDLYGIELKENRCKQLQHIRDTRNRLAHGESSFREIGGNISTQCLRDLKDKTIEFLESFIMDVSTYVTERRYACNGN